MHIFYFNPFPRISNSFPRITNSFPRISNSRERIKIKYVHVPYGLPYDRAEYAEILKQTSAMKHGNNKASNKPKSSKRYKYKVIIKPVWEDLYGTVGRGLKTVVIPSAHHALADRLELLLPSKAAGNTGLRKELVSICDELLRQKLMTKPLYKK